MTPREPDRYEEKARELLEAHDLNRSTIAATLRQAADEALERVRLHFNDVEHGPLSLARAREWLDREIRSLASPAAAPAAETCRAECASRMPDYSHYECTLPKGHSGAHREGGTEWTDKDTVVSPPSEPVAPSLLIEQVERAEKAEKRIAELEAARDAFVNRSEMYRTQLHTYVKKDLAAQARIADLEHQLQECERALIVSNKLLGAGAAPQSGNRK